MKPLCERLVNLKIPMGFIYGDDDFFETRGAVYIADRVKQPVIISMLPNSGHHLYWDNPKQLGREILNIIHLLNNPV